MSKMIPSRLTGLPVGTKIWFFIGQAILLASFPIEILAAFRQLPGFAEAQANEALILALCAYIPFTIVCELVAWLGFVKRQTFGMMVGTLAPLVALLTLMFLASYTV